jgi:lipopolysaccharide transport system permease protein
MEAAAEVAAARRMEYRPRGMDQTLNQVLPALPAADMDISAERTHGHRQWLAWQDVAAGLTLWRLGLTLGWLDIKLKYRGSVLGPFWLTISTAIWIGAMGGLYSLLFHMDLHGYLPFLALSLVLWTSVGGLVGDACNTFLQSEAMIRSLRMPFFVHTLRVVVRTVISLLHNVPVVIAVFLIFGVHPGAVAWLSLPGLVLWTLDGFAACMLLGAVCARFRDIPPIVGSVMQIAFFITPIMWQPAQLGTKGWWLPFNPFDSLLEVVRQPLLGLAPTNTEWYSAVGFSAVLCVVTWLLFARIRSRLAFWI